MMLKITQLIKEWFSRMRNISPLPMDPSLWRPLFIVLAITLLSYEAVDLLYKIISFPLMQQTVAAKANMSAPVMKDHTPPDSLQAYEIITGRNLFQSTLKAVVDKQSEGMVFDSDQKAADFDLKGTVACNSSFGFIFIEERDSRKQKLYRLGDNIGSAKLVKITRNTATLRSGGKETTVRIKATIEGQLLPNTPGSGRQGSSTRNVNLSKKNVTENLNDLKSIMNQASVRPYLNKGVQEGYIVSRIVTNSIFEKMGLQNGDILIDINGTKIQNINNLMDMVTSMQSGSSFFINIKRNDNIETLNYFFD